VSLISLVASSSVMVFPENARGNRCAKSTGKHSNVNLTGQLVVSWFEIKSVGGPPSGRYFRGEGAAPTD